jgi:DNA-3-methyladenine glycosylase I
MAKALKRNGFVFVGPTTAYAAMQACGLVDDHVEGCHVPPPGDQRRESAAKVPD